MEKCVGIMIAKSSSLRLPDKNKLDFFGAPLFEWNLKKIISTGITVYFDSDSEEMLLRAEELGAIPHLRPNQLLGHNIPSVPIFEHIHQDFSLKKSPVLNIQANSPNVPLSLIENAIFLLNNLKINELLTFYSNLKINGSLWGFSSQRLLNYGNPYEHKPDIMLNDNSIDIHNSDEFRLALSFEKNKKSKSK